MQINFDRVDARTLYKVHLSDVLSNKHLGEKMFPTIWLNTDIGIYGPKSRAAAKGFVFTHQGVACGIVGRLITHVIATWPDSRKFFKDIVNDPETGSIKKEGGDAPGSKKGEGRRRKNGSKGGGHPASGSRVRLGSRKSRGSDRPKKRVKS